MKRRERERLSDAEVASRFGVGLSTVMRWRQRIEPKLKRVKAPTKIHREALRQEVRDYPEAYPYERARRLGVSARGIGHALQRLKLSRKKSLQHPRADQAAQTHFQQKITAYEAARRAIVYVDESGFAHDMPRTHGYALRGQRGALRCGDQVPRRPVQEPHSKFPLESLQSLARHGNR